MSQKNDKKQKLWAMRHSAEHVLTQAMLALYPGLKMAMGPATDDGFYFDFDYDPSASSGQTPSMDSTSSPQAGSGQAKKISEEDFPKIEAEMQKTISADLPFKKEVLPVEKARKLFKGNEYKQEWLDEIALRQAQGKKAKGNEAVIYKTGNKFTDLCAGPHVASTGKIGAFKLLSVAGAYWRGDEKNKMLTRIYGTAFPTQKELRQYLTRLEEAKKRDHRKLGKELDLFCFSELVGPGLPLYTPRGTTIIDELQKHIESVCRNYGFGKVMTPHLAKLKLFELSGHVQKFNEEIFRVSSLRDHEFALKPVQCPHQTQIYASRPRSYRDLPIRYMESERQYRAEKSGEVGGLNRVYAITVEDGHSFCRVDQIKDEVKGMVNIIKDFYTALGLWGNHWVSLSVRDYDHPEKYIGEPKDWDKCEEMLKEVSSEMKLDAKTCEGEAALYGPKLDFMFRDALGNEIQIPTVQVDFATPKRFGLTYTDKSGQKVSPVMVHRAVLGSYERLLALLIEHFAGAFPVWLSPVQVKVLPITDKNKKYATETAKKISDENIRVELDSRNETLQAKIRDAQLEKIPYMLVIGAREESAKKVAVRLRTEKNLGQMSLDKFIERVREIIDKKALEL